MASRNNRSNAQRLSISLAPLVAQRPLLFRIKTDLAGAGKEGVQSYDELDDVEESPLLYERECKPLLGHSALAPIDNDELPPERGSSF